MIDLVVRVFNTVYPSPYAKLVALAIARRAGSEKGFCWASMATLQRDTGIARSTFYRALRQLENAAPEPYLRRWQRAPLANGKRRTDLLGLCFPSVVLEAVAPAASQAELDSGQLAFWDLAETEGVDDVPDHADEALTGADHPSPAPTGPDHPSPSLTDSGPESRSGTGTPEKGKDPESPSGTPRELSASPSPLAQEATENPAPGQNSPALAPKESFEESPEERTAPAAPASPSPALPSDPAFWASRIWAAGSPISRDRSDPAKTEEAVRDARRRAPGVTDAAWLEAAVQVVSDYCATDAAVKEAGRYCLGVHRIVARESFEASVRALLEAKAKREAAEAAKLPPSREVQVGWVRAYARSGLWHKSQGPEPFCFGCRVAPDILKAYDYAGKQVAEAERRLEIWHRSQRWDRAWGPPPVEPDCWIPAEIIDRVASNVAQALSAEAASPASGEAPEPVLGDPGEPDAGDDAAAFA